MKLPKLPLRKKLRASTARRSIASADEMDYEEMSEPNMKLSRALLIVLVLHVVAVAGIIAFNTIKSRQGAVQTGASAPVPAARSTSTPPAGPAAAASAAVANQTPLPTTAESIPADTMMVARALPVTSDTAGTYTVVKGDNPVAIARKLNVSKDELLTLNKITDPTKLQIGQTLLVPAKTIAKPAPKATPKPAAKATPKPTTKPVTKSSPKPAAKKSRKNASFSASGERGRLARCFWRPAENFCAGSVSLDRAAIVRVSREAHDPAGEAPALPGVRIAATTFVC